MSCTGIVLAAGSGVRVGTPKQFELIGGKRLWQYAWYNMLEADVFDHVSVIVVGGPTRMDSLRKGVESCDTEYVIFTDASRPYTPAWVFKDMYKLLGDVPVAVVQPMYDSTLFKDEPLDRTLITCIQTPNGFKRKLLLELLDNSFYGPVIHEYMRRRGEITQYKTDFYNQKVTTVSDLEHVRRYYGSKSVNA